jgi:hypothetical protein
MAFYNDIIAFKFEENSVLNGIMIYPLFSDGRIPTFGIRTNYLTTEEAVEYIIKSGRVFPK